MSIKRKCIYIIKPVLIGVGISLLILTGIRFYQLTQTIEIFQTSISSYSTAVKKAAPAIVNIYSQQYIDSSIDNKQHLEPIELGSGVIFDENGYIVTNYHVVSNADQIQVALQNGKILIASVIGTDIPTDIAVLHIEEQNLPVIPQNEKYLPQVGDVALAIGNPFNLGQTVTSGIISATGRRSLSSTGRQNFIQTDAPINKGNSGGALINTRGELVGLITSEFFSKDQNVSNGISFAIPYSLLKRITSDLMKNGRVIRGSLGIRAENLNPLLASLWGLDVKNSIIIKEAYKGQAAEKAGVLIDDVLLQINEIAVKDVIDAIDIIANIKPGTKTQLTLLRNGKEVKLDVIIDELAIADPF